jgi:hypothetical protein
VPPTRSELEFRTGCAGPMTSGSSTSRSSTTGSGRRDCGVDVCDTVAVVLEPEGPQRGELAEDVVAALAANPEGGAFFDSLAQFYRRGYLRWVDAIKRSPERRAERIAEMVRLLGAGVKECPRA